MTPMTCSHCGKPVYVGNLCNDCQALRAQHPNVFFANTNGNPNRIDKGAVYAVSSLLAFAALVAFVWPYMARSIKGHNKPVAKTERPLLDPASVSMPIQTTTPAYATPPTYQPTAPPQNPPQTSYLQQNYWTDQNRARYKSGPIARPMEAVAIVANNTAAAGQQLGSFVQAYCRDRSDRTGQPVSSTGVSMFPDGAGAALSFDEGGQFSQGTASFTPQSGWAWVQTPH